MRLTYAFALLISNVALFAPLFIDPKDPKILYIMLPIALVLNGLLVDLRMRTFYEFDEKDLKYRIGFVSGKIDLSKATALYRNRSIWSIQSNIKPSWTMSPIVLKYNRFDEMPFSPDNEEDFIQEIVSRNPDIQLFD